MTTTQIKERITKTEQTIAKKEELITKREKAISKKLNELKNLGYKFDREENDYSGALITLRNAGLAKDNWNEAYWTACDIDSYTDSIKSANKAIKEAKDLLVKYNNMLAVEEQKENSINELPELFNDFQQYLITNWDEYDIANKNYLKAQYNKLGHREFVKNYGRSGYQKMFQTDEEIHKTNVKNARAIILDLVDRVSAKTGKITDYKGLRLSQNNAGFSILNGVVKGENGTATVESILAGGYNIQRLHIRVLVK